MTEGGDVQQRLYRWIDQQLQATQGRDPLRELVLSHLNASDQLQEIARFPLLEGDTGRLKAELYRTALEVVASWRHFQRFAVQAFFGSSDKPGAYYPMALADDTPTNGPEPTEPANIVGALKQQMRHNEVLARINAGIQRDALEQQTALARSAYDELTKLRADFATLFRETHNMSKERAELELERIRLTAAEQRKDRMANSVEVTLPRLVNGVSKHFGGPALLPENASSLELTLAAMLKGLNDAQFDQLCAIFGPAEQMQLLELYNRLVRAPAQASSSSNGNGAAGKH